MKTRARGVAQPRATTWLRPMMGTHRLLQIGFGQGAPQVGQRIDTALTIIKELRVEVWLTGLLLLAAAMMIDGVQNLAAAAAGAAQVQRALAAVAADFQARPAPAGRQGRVVQGPALGRVEKAFGTVDERLGNIHGVESCGLQVIGCRLLSDPSDPSDPSDRSDRWDPSDRLSRRLPATDDAPRIQGPWSWLRTSTSRGLTPSAGPITPSRSMVSMILAARL